MRKPHNDALWVKFNFTYTLRGFKVQIKSLFHAEASIFSQGLSMASSIWPCFLFPASALPSGILFTQSSFFIEKKRIKKALLTSGCDRMNVKIQLQCEQNNCRFDLGRWTGVTHTPTWLTAWGTPAQSSNCCFWHCLSLRHGWGFWRADGRSSAICLNPSFEFRH